MIPVDRVVWNPLPYGRGSERCLNCETLHYRVEKSRGKDVIFDTLGAHFGGVLVSDCLACYENLPFIMHKCYAHHLKAIAQARDRKPEALRSFFQELSALLRSAMTYRRPSSREFVNTSMVALILF